GIKEVQPVSNAVAALTSNKNLIYRFSLNGLKLYSSVYLLFSLLNYSS
ncbi:MAG: hypothetical protein ACI9FJ_003069, partial [Alteromonadaceae bacterium]